MSEQNKIKDERKKGWFMFPNDFLNGYAKYVGWKGQVVYIALSRHADNEGRCFPGIKHLAIELGVSEDSIKRGVQALKDYNIHYLGQLPYDQTIEDSLGTPKKLLHTPFSNNLQEILTTFI